MNTEDKMDVKDAVKLGVMEGMKEHYEKAHSPLNDQISAIKKTMAWGSGIVTAVGAWLKFGGH